MLSERYNSCIIGFSYQSLILGILSLKRNKSTLIVNDSFFNTSDHWYHSVSEIDLGVLKNLNLAHGIDSIKKIDKHITPKFLSFSFNQKRLSLTDSPFINVQEIARKVPECFSTFFVKEIESYGEEQFNVDFFKYIDHQANGYILGVNDTSHFVKIENLIRAFIDYTRRDVEEAKEFLFILQMYFLKSFHKKPTDKELTYLFASLISPHFLISDSKLTSSLAYTFQKLGGDFSNTEVKEFGVYQNQLKHILLNSIDGIIDIDRCVCFTPDLKLKKFEYTVTTPTKRHYSHALITVPLKGISLDLAETIFIGTKGPAGDFPLTIFEIYNNDNPYVLIRSCYLEMKGTDIKYYKEKILETCYGLFQDLFESHLSKEQWLDLVSMEQGIDQYIERVGDKVLSPLVYDNKKNRIDGLEYFCADFSGVQGHVDSYKALFTY